MQFQFADRTKPLTKRSLSSRIEKPTIKIHAAKQQCPWKTVIESRRTKTNCLSFSSLIMTKLLLFRIFVLTTIFAISLSAFSQTTPVNVPRLKKGDSIVIYYDVTINSGLPPAVTSISNQLSISGLNFLSFLSDDPRTISLFDPTITLLDPPPVVSSVVRKTPLNSLTNATTVIYTVNFSKIVNGVDVSDFTLANTASVNGTIASVSSSTGTSIDVTVNSITGDGTMRLDVNASGTGITDNYSKPLDGGFITGEIYSFDHTLPVLSSVTISSNNANTAYAKVGDIITLSFTASETIGTPTVTIATHSVTTTPGAGNSFTASYTMLVTDAEGIIPFTIDFADGVGNTGAQVATTTNSSSVIFDRTAPSVTIDQAAGQADPSGGTIINFTVVFNESVTGFATGDVIVSGTAGATTATVTEIAPMNGTTFNVAVGGMTTTGTVIATINAGVATDGAGHNNNASTSIDNTVTWVACQVTCPVVSPVNNDEGQCGAIVNYSPATTTGNCGTLTYSHPSGSFFPVGTTMVTVSSASTGQSCQFAVTVNDTEDPEITSCPGNQLANTANNLCTASVPFAAIATDNCSTGLTLKYYIGATEIFSPYNFPKGITTVMVKAKDAAGNEVTCTFEVTVNDNQVPSITPPTNKTFYTGAGAVVCSKLVSIADFGSASSSDNCGTPTVAITGVPAGNIFPVGNTILIYRATDGSNNTATAQQTITVIDNTPPVLSCPGNVTVYTGPGRNTCNQLATWTAPTPTDNCGIQSLAANKNPGDQFPIGNTTVTYTATDVNNNTSTCSFTVTVIDNTAPVISGCPSNITVYTGVGNNNCTQTATWTQPAATDNCSNITTWLSRSHVPGATFGIGTTPVTYVFEDGAGNRSTCSFSVTVVDNTAPVISNCPANITVTAGANCQATATWTSPTATDNCNGSLNYFSRSHAPGSTFGAGTTTVTYVFKDAANNESICFFTVTVSDNTPPTVSAVVATPSVIWPPDHKMKDIVLSYTSTDNCGCTPVVTVTSNEELQGTGDNDQSPDWQIIDATHLKLRAERGNGKEARVYTIRVTCTDASGNSTFKETEVRIAHNITSPHSGSPFIVGSTINFNGVFWDKQGNKHTGKWLIDDNTQVKAIVTEPSGTKNGKMTGSYKFTTAGIYKLQMNLTDQTGITSWTNTNDDLEEIVVIYDPNGGFTNGGGWFNSQAGAYKADPTAIGKASYGFTVNYFKNATNPKGEVQFELKVGNFEFNALNFDYMVVQGAKAQFRGTGKVIGGQSGIGFTMTVIDGQLDGTGTDKVRMKIYNKASGEIYYDNQPNASDAANPVNLVGTNSSVMIGGTIVNINNALTQKTTTAPAKEEEVVSSLQVNVAPNPSTSTFIVNVAVPDPKQKTIMQVFDNLGRLKETLNVTGNRVELGNKYLPGSYYIRVMNGKEHKEVKIIKM